MIPIINILLIVGILLFILYNLYVDTRNWSNTGSFLEGMGNQFDLPLVTRYGIRQSWNPPYGTPSTRGGTSQRLGRCEGDCDSDSQCLPGLKCFQRNGQDKINECSGKGISGWDYCYDPFPLIYPGWQVLRNKSIEFSGNARGANDKDVKGKSAEDAINIAFPLNSQSKRENIWAIERNEGQQWTIFRTRKEDGSIPEHRLVSSTGWGVHKNPNQPFMPGTLDEIIYNTVTKLRDFCGDGTNDTTKMEWKGKDCGDGKIKWLSMKSLAGTTRDGFPQGCSWDRKTDDLNWNNKYVGQCGVAPTYMPGLPESRGSISAGSASAAIGSQVSKRAGAVAPMEESRAQKCLDGCVEPTQVSGNCKVVNIEGKEMRECPYKCSNYDVDDSKCQYDQDCNSCGSKRFEPDKQPTMESMENMEQNTDPSMDNSDQVGSLESSTNPVIGEQTPNVNALFNESIMKEILAKKDLIPDDLNKNNEKTSDNLRIGKKFMINAASIRNYALPNIDNQDYIEVGRIVKNIKTRENDPREGDQVKALYTKLNTFVLELLNDSSLGMSDYYSRGIPKQLNNKTRTTGMFGENSNSLMSDSVKENVKRQKVKPYNSIWGLYQ